MVDPSSFVLVPGHDIIERYPRLLTFLGKLLLFLFKKDKRVVSIQAPRSVIFVTVGPGKFLTRAVVLVT